MSAGLAPSSTDAKAMQEARANGSHMKTMPKGLVRVKMQWELVEMIVAGEMNAYHKLNMAKEKKRKMEENLDRKRRKKMTNLNYLVINYTFYRYCGWSRDRGL